MLSELLKIPLVYKQAALKTLPKTTNQMHSPINCVYLPSPDIQCNKTRLRLK